MSSNNNLDNKRKVIILGAGVSGLCAAWRLSENNFDVEVYEKNSFVGGLAATIKIDNYFMDFGPHPFYSDNESILAIFKELIGSDLISFERDCLLLFNDLYIHYPPDPKDILFNMGIKTSVLSVSSYLKSKLKNSFVPSNIENFENWAISSFGSHLYKIFFKPYTENFWKVSPDKLSCDWADARVARLNLIKAIKLLFSESKKRSSLNQIERDTLPLYYPKHGCGVLSERLAEKVKSNGGKIYLNSEIKKVNIPSIEKSNVLVNVEGVDSIVEGNYIISTLPLKHLVKMTNPKPNNEIQSHADSLNSLGLIIVFFALNIEDVLPVSYLYCMHNIYHRITEYNKFSAKLSPDGENLLSVEISCYKDDEVWKIENNELVENCTNGLISDGYIKKDNIIKSFVFKSSNVYPVYFLGYEERLKKIKNFYSEFEESFLLLGRSGQYNYIDQDQAMKMGFDLADKIHKKY